MYATFLKRVFDFVIAAVGIVLLSPLMAAIALAVKIDSKGPAVFKARRAGKNGKPFTCYKFRSMRTDAPPDRAPRLLKGEVYITRVGAFIRKTSLDELPQLFCILKGDMALVGPRPSGLSESDLLSARERYHANGVRPGLTGLAQIKGRDVLALNPEEKAKVDGEYCRKITFTGDAAIVFTTARQVLFAKDIIR